MKLEVGKRYLSNGNGNSILKCIAERNEVFIVENDYCCYYVDSKGIALYLNEFGDYEEYNDRPDLDLVCEVVSAEEDSSPDVDEVFNKMIEMKVGNFYFSKKAGVLECIAERDGEFIVDNAEYGYHVNSHGKIPSYFAADEEHDCNLQYSCTKEGTPIISEDEKHSHYFKDVSKLEKIDVYTILSLYEVTDPCIQHAVKKLLCTGKRGHKDFLKDVQDSVDSLVRCIELNEELSK